MIEIEATLTKNEYGADKVAVGDMVAFVDQLGRKHAALVTAVWPGYASMPSYGGLPGVNVVFVSADPARGDSYGRQVERDSSVPHKSGQPAPGYYWCMWSEA